MERNNSILFMLDVGMTATNRIYVKIDVNYRERCFTALQSARDKEKKCILYSKVTQANVDNLTTIAFLCHKLESNGAR